MSAFQNGFHVTHLSFVLLLGSLLCPTGAKAESTPTKTGSSPNIVYILCDDLGYGDVHTLNPERGKIATPKMDTLASQGMIFTDAHSGSSVCSPTRYGIMTGRYAWRTKLQSGVLNGYSTPLIAPGRTTVASFLKSHGYATACIGKWHIGMEMTPKTGGKKNEIDYALPIKNGPVDVGFDYYYGISASLDMPPYVFIENNKFTELPTVEKKWIRQGPAAKSFEAIDVLPTLKSKAVQFVKDHATDAKGGKPFFMYVPLNSPHTPILPSAEWKGKSGLGDYGDFVMQTDDAIGQIVESVDQSGLKESTLIIVTSDNGCSPAAKVDDLEKQGHFPSAQFRGYKADIWEGGHRIPFIARWTGKIAEHSSYQHTVCLTDLFATAAELVNDKPPANAAEDSVSILPALLGKTAPLREATVHHSIQGHFAIRMGEWKLELTPGSGGWGSPTTPQAISQKLPAMQLYNMQSDISEKENLSGKNADKVAALKAMLEKYVAQGRSTPGEKQANDVEIKLIKAKVGAATDAEVKAKGD